MGVKDVKAKNWCVNTRGNVNISKKEVHRVRFNGKDPSIDDVKSLKEFLYFKEITSNASRVHLISSEMFTNIRSTLPRLLNGSDPCAGRLEIYWNGNWGTVCKDEAWSSPEAEAVCQLLDCGSVTAMPLISDFGPGSGPVVGREGCGHQQGFAVICSDESWSLSLTDGGSSCDGRVEIYHNSSWGRVQDSFWDLNDANVVCRQLECGDAIATSNSSKYGEGDAPVWVNDVHCEGNESHLRSCRSFLLDSSLDDRFGVGVLCSGHEQLRLSDGGNRCAGRVEIYYNGTWGSVCDDSWDVADAHVVCKQLSCGTALDVQALPASSGPSEDPVWLDEVNCSGNELFLWDCPSASWGNHDCNHKEDVNIMCSEYKELRLVNGKHRCEGRVEVFYNGTWGTVCSDKLDNHDAEVICKQLHCGTFSYINYDAQLFGPGTGPIWLDKIECNLNERTLWQCQTDPWGKHNCEHSEDAGVVCSESIVGKEEPDRPAECDRKSDLGLPVRLVGGANNCSGRVEILCNNRWGTVCDGSWDIDDANVVCRQSDCGSALFAPGGAYFTQGEGDIWLEEVKCTGMESFLSDCAASSSAQSDCNHKEDASVICSAQGIEKSSIPVAICITLGVLLICELLALIAVIQRTLKRKGAVTGASGPPAGLYQGIYEEIESIPSGKIFGETCGTAEGTGMHKEYGKLEMGKPKKENRMWLYVNKYLSGLSGSMDSLNQIEYYTSHSLDDADLGSEIPAGNCSSFQDLVLGDYADAETEAHGTQDGHLLMNRDPENGFTERTAGDDLSPLDPNSKITEFLTNCKDDQLLLLTKFYRDRLEQAIEGVARLCLMFAACDHIGVKESHKVNEIADSGNLADCSTLLLNLVIEKGSRALRVMWESFVEMHRGLPKLEKILRELPTLGPDAFVYMNIPQGLSEVPSNLKDLQQKHKETLRVQTETLRVNTILIKEKIKIFQLVDRYAELTVISTVRDRTLVGHELLARGRDHEEWREKHLRKELEKIRTDQLLRQNQFSPSGETHLESLRGSRPGLRVTL
ncbi:scavenger receptor cysteine-rich domain-containing protein DMBT1-like [Mustelus asterias]